MRWVVVALMVSGISAAAQMNLISVDDEIQMGRQAQQQVKRAVPEITDRAVNAYFLRIGRRLVQRTTGPKYPYSFNVANYQEINAFALPGGPVWVHRGAIAAADNEAQLAAVLAHEIAHISQRHAADQISKQLVANGFIGLLGAMLGNVRSAETAQVGARILAHGYLLKFSREHEREADAVGATIMRRAGWDAREMVVVLNALAKQQASNPAALEIFLSSHPAPAERAERLRRTVKGGGTKDSAAFQQIKARLGRMPAARRMRR